MGRVFEPVFLLAVGSLVSRRDTLAEPLRDGIYWGAGLLHSLAGSGALVLLVVSGIRTPWLSVIYFAVFDVGSILGVFVVAGLCSVLFTKHLRISRVVKVGAVTLSSVVCILYGRWMIYGNVRW